MKKYNITNIESQVLFKKYTQGGLTIEQANKRLKSIKDYFNFKVEQWKNKKLSENEIEIKFKNEFEKLLLKADAEFD